MRGGYGREKVLAVQVAWGRLQELWEAQSTTTPYVNVNRLS
jgi:hypothetical protein